MEKRSLSLLSPPDIYINIEDSTNGQLLLLEDFLETVIFSSNVLSCRKRFIKMVNLSTLLLLGFPKVKVLARTDLGAVQYHSDAYRLCNSKYHHDLGVLTIDFKN